MPSTPVRLKFLLRDRHWQTYRTFCNEYDKAARSIDPKLVGTWPSRAQLHRWLAGELKGIPYPDHCRILEAMFPGWTAERLFEPCGAEQLADLNRDHDFQDSRRREFESLSMTVSNSLDAPESTRSGWERSPHPSGGSQGGGSGLPLPLSEHELSGAGGLPQALGRHLVALKKVLRLSEAEVHQLARLSGTVVDLSVAIDIDINSDGDAVLTYRYEVLNLSSKPITRLARELWFEEADTGLKIAPLRTEGRRVAIQRIHDTANLAKFACQISPPIQPGEVAEVAYTAHGGRFVESTYWRQGIPRFTRHLTIRLRHRNVPELVSCMALEEHADGSENSVTDELLWDYEDKDVVATLTCDYLRPNQAVTLRWEINREPA